MTASSTRSAPAVSDASQMDAVAVAANRGEVVYLDGRYMLKNEVFVSPDDRGFLLGDGIYEVAAAYDGKFVALDRHMDRLRSSLREARIDDSVADPLESVFTGLLERNGFAESGKTMVYLQVTRGAAPRTHAFPKTPVRPTVYAYAAPFPDMGDFSVGVGAIVRPDLRWSRCDIKSISLMGNVLENQRAKDAGAFEAILVRDGVVLEGTHTSIFGVIGGEVRTAPLSNLILPGVTRAIVIDLCRDNDFPIREEPMSEDELRSAEELFLTGTTTEVVGIISLDGKPVGDGRPGPITVRLENLYMNAIRVSAI
ncbi:MAG TPA: aminotransferase class IV [Gemmatimonadaceae bacterium]|nr:aminotransferase class IV [Gemmatimonadaceae bacterium]